MLFITNPILYAHPNNDPVFKTGHNILKDDKGLVFHNASALVSILGCIEELEVCNPATAGAPVCVTSTGLLDPDHPTSLESLHLIGEQMATLTRLLTILSGTTFAFTSISFLASRSLFLGVQFAELSSTHWRLEVSRWFSIGLAMAQQGFVDSVTSPGDPQLKEGFRELAGMEASCKRQIVRNAVGFQNFNMQAIVLVLALGGATIVLGLTIDVIVGLFQRRFLRDSQGWVHWTLDGVFQLQRLAYRGAGVGSWRDEDTYIPTVGGGPLPPIDRKTMAFAGCDSEEELKLIQEPPGDGVAEESSSDGTPLHISSNRQLP
ncbi:hypothetical protein IMZ48_33525 [Candidatus Bathyarchaeota archaeon]|nr:hypothetical protein [Candidatus Bathyarchaeota archaeon]